jgi:hypothetical protein
MLCKTVLSFFVYSVESLLYLGNSTRFKLKVVVVALTSANLPAVGASKKNTVRIDLHKSTSHASSLVEEVSQWEEPGQGDFCR